MSGATHAARTFGKLAPLLAPSSVAVIGASEREGNLGGIALGFLQKFGFDGALYAVHRGGRSVRGVRCYASLRDLPTPAELAVVALPATGVLEVLRECAQVGTRAAIVWAGGFAETGEEGAARQRELAQLCRDEGILLCGPNCLGIINTAIGLTASFSSMLAEQATLVRGAVSMVSQSGGIAVMAHARAQAFGLGFRVTVSCGNEAVLGIADFMSALIEDEGTRVLAVYAEALSDPGAFVAALDEARRRRKPVVIIKGGAGEASGRAALAHTGRLAGSDRTFDALIRELGAIRVYSTEELLDVSLQLASMKPGQAASDNRVLVTSFGGGSGVVATDQCEREGLTVPSLDDATRNAVAGLVTPLSSVANPLDFTPGMVTDARHRGNLPAALDTLSRSSATDAWLFLAAGFARHAPEVATAYNTVRAESAKPMCISWQAMPAGIPELLASHGIYAFTESARAARTLRHIVRYSKNLRHHMARDLGLRRAFDWSKHAGTTSAARVLPEHVVAAILTDAGLPVAPGRCARTTDEAVAAARDVGFPVAMKALSPQVTHRAAAGLLALGVDGPRAVAARHRELVDRAAALGVMLDGVWIQHMFATERELLVTAFVDAQFGTMIGCGIGGALTEIVDDVAFARAPISVDGASDLLDELRTLRRLPSFLSARQRDCAADFISRLSSLAAAAPWQEFTLEVNPLALGHDAAAAVDGLLIIES